MTTIAPPRGTRSGLGERLRAGVVGLDWVLLLAVAAITGFSLFVIGRSTEGDIEGDPRFYLDRQILFVAIGAVAMIVAIRVNLDHVAIVTVANEKVRDRVRELYADAGRDVPRIAVYPPSFQPVEELL